MNVIVLAIVVAVAFAIVATVTITVVVRQHKHLCYLQRKLVILQKRNERLRQKAEKAQYDELTGLMQRVPLKRALKKLRALLPAAAGDKREVRASIEGLSVLLIDVDHFKLINDTYGHPFGDTVLQAVAAAMARALRESDYLGRWGGEEFVAVLPNVRTDRALVVAEKVREAVATFRFEHDLRVTVSIGVACARQQSEFESLFDKADTALYKAKESGRNRVVVSNGR